MNQGIAGDIAAVMDEVRSVGLLSALCTITVPPHVFDAGGAPDPSAAYEDLTGHVDLPCMAAPLPGGEAKTLAEIEAKTAVQLLLDGYYPLILADYRAKIDSIEWDILNVSSDSQAQMTVLTVQRVTL